MTSDPTTALALALAALETPKPEPPPRIQLWHPHDAGFDPQNPEHVPALRLYPGAVFLGGNRYRIGQGLVVDRLGAFRDAAECPECGSSELNGDLSYHVRQLPEPGSKPWQITFRPCRRCVGADERAENEAFVAGSDTGKGRK